MTIPFSSAWVAFGHHEHHFPFLRDHLGIILVDFGYPGEPLGTMGIILCALGTLWASFWSIWRPFWVVWGGFGHHFGALRGHLGIIWTPWGAMCGICPNKVDFGPPFWSQKYIKKSLKMAPPKRTTKRDKIHTLLYRFGVVK